MGCAGRRMTLPRYKASIISIISTFNCKVPSTYIVVFILWEQCIPLLQERNELIRHFLQALDITVCIGVTEPCTDWVIDKHNICKLVPGTVVIFKSRIVLQPVRANFHQRPVFGTASGATIEPYYRPLPVCNVPVLVMPKEQIAVMFWVDFDEAAGRTISNETGRHLGRQTLRASSIRDPLGHRAMNEQSSHQQIFRPPLLAATTALIEPRISIHLCPLAPQEATRRDASLRPPVDMAASNADFVDKATDVSSRSEISSAYEVVFPILSSGNCCLGGLRE